MRILRAGFTLIELLVVIAIIAILAAILLPIFAQAIHQAKESHCQNNLKQIGNAFEMYRNDWEDFYPVAHNLHNANWYAWEPENYHTSRTPNGAAEPFWWECLRPYVKNEEIFKDPLDKGVGESWATGYDSMYDYWANKLTGAPWNRPGDETRNADFPNGMAMSCSYVWNGTLGWKDYYQTKGPLYTNWKPDGNCVYVTLPSNGGPSPKRQGAIQRPAVRYLCWDTCGYWHRTRKIKNSSGAWVGVSAGWTVLFTDTHVKWVDWKSFDETGGGLVDADVLMTWYVPIESDRAP